MLRYRILEIDHVPDDCVEREEIAQYELLLTLRKQELYMMPERPKQGNSAFSSPLHYRTSFHGCEIANKSAR